MIFEFYKTESQMFFIESHRAMVSCSILFRWKILVTTEGLKKRLSQFALRYLWFSFGMLYRGEIFDLG